MYYTGFRYLSIFLLLYASLCYYYILFHYISEEDIVVFTPLQFSEREVYLLLLLKIKDNNIHRRLAA